MYFIVRRLCLSSQVICLSITHPLVFPIIKKYVNYRSFTHYVRKYNGTNDFALKVTVQLALYTA